ncbi:hypothetical protein H4Q26_011984 [Puccinia striiformis f. sp. tritici PST-130]|nr:hypothetical protein H4Q26_011984 [Puccinia striiformis f. sp. tritici PST-130]
MYSGKADTPSTAPVIPLGQMDPNLRPDATTRPLEPSSGTGLLKSSSALDSSKPSAKQEAYRVMAKDMEKLNVKNRVPSGQAVNPAPPRKTGVPIGPTDGSFGGHKNGGPSSSSRPGYESDSNPLGIDMSDGPTDFMNQQQSEDALRELVEGMYEGDMDSFDAEAAMPEGLSCKLLPHQVVGVNWMKDREQGKKKGGILADDMGFGENGAPKTTLVVCPLALKDQWVDEVEQKSDLSVILYHGSKRHQIAHKLHKYRVVVTTYDVISSEWQNPKKAAKAGAGASEDEDEPSDSSGGKKSKTTRAKKAKPSPLFTKEDGSPMRFWRIILDEAHIIKNRNTHKTKACFELRGNYKWCLTGTPIQYCHILNGVEDIFPLLRFIGPSVKPFNDYAEFKDKILKPMKGNKGKAAIARIQALLKIILLRRSKDSKDKAGNPILKLPGKELILLRTPFRTTEETEFYQTVSERMAERMAKISASGDVQKSYITILTLILRLRQATLHPALGSEKADADSLEATDTKNAAPVEDMEDKVDGLADMMGGMVVKQDHTKCSICLEVLPPDQVDAVHCTACARQLRLAKTFEGMQNSTKVSRLLELLDEIKAEDTKTHKKTIVFSQFTSFLNLIEPFIKKAGYGYTRYDGAKSADEKTRALEKIKSDPKCTVLLISLKCGSVGLNLTCCSRVILMDPWWNPSIETQAFDRAHRFGQREDVKCYKITIADTIEDRILQLQKDKQSLANQALGTEAAKKMNKLSVAEILSSVTEREMHIPGEEKAKRLEGRSSGDATRQTPPRTYLDTQAKQGEKMSEEVSTETDPPTTTMPKEDSTGDELLDVPLDKLFDDEMDVDVVDDAEPLGPEEYRHLAQYDDPWSDLKDPHVMMNFYRRFTELLVHSSRVCDHLTNDAYLRYNSYSTWVDLQKDIIRLNPTRFEIGPIYSAPPKDRKSLPKASFKPIVRELVFDIDLTDYDDIRNCCSDKKICVKCWKFISLAIQVLDLTLRQDFGYRHLLWVYSGRRGAHCWVSDHEAMRLNDEKGKRSSISNLRSILCRTQLGNSDYVFKNIILQDQDVFKEEAKWKFFLRIWADPGLIKDLEPKWTTDPELTSEEKWGAVTGHYNLSNTTPLQKKKLKETMSNVILHYTYPRIDLEVSKHLNHLLKSPFCVHPATGKVPDVRDLLRELDKHPSSKNPTTTITTTDQNHQVLNWYHTSLRPYVEFFQDHVNDLLKDRLQDKKDLQTDSLEF